MGVKEIAIYCRVSSDEQAEYGYNLREQERRIEQYIEVYNEEFEEKVVKYIDDGYSARNLNRKEMKVLIEDIKNEKIGKLIIHNLDRLTRNVVDLMYLLELLDNHNVQLFSVKEKIDTRTAIGRFFVSMIILVAQWETEAISERTIRGMDQSAYEGNYVHGKAPYGYDLVEKKLVINDREASIIKEAHYQFLYEYRSVSELMHIFNNKHRDEKFMWTYDRIRIMLTNLLYTGTYKNSRITIENHSPTIVGKGLFEDVQANLKLRNRRDQYPYLFKGKCYCHRTEEQLTVKPTKKVAAYYLYYKNSKGEYINEEIINNKISSSMNNHLKNLCINSIESKVNTLKRKDVRIGQLDYLLDKGAISIDYYRNRCKKLREKINKSEEVIALVASELGTWSEMSISQKQLFVIENVEKIVLDLGGKKIINVKFKNM